jgi:hypothetical protein
MGFLCLTMPLCATERITAGKAQKSLGFLIGARFVSLIMILEEISGRRFRPAERLQTEQKILVADIALEQEHRTGRFEQGAILHWVSRKLNRGIAPSFRKFFPSNDEKCLWEFCSNQRRKPIVWHDRTRRISKENPLRRFEAP